MRSLLRRLRAEKWRFSRPLFDLDSRGVGRAVYRARSGAGRVLSLAVFARDLPAALRSDRVIATAWDASFALFDGDPTAADLSRLARAAPRQEAGRYTARELSLSRANRSVRLFSHCVDALAAGERPRRRLLLDVGYLMRTTAVYGNGKFGLADREIACDRVGSRAPFQCELLAVWLARAFAADWVEHLARVRNPAAARFSRADRRLLGIGNSTGLGMAPFLINHPALLHRWILAREIALQRARAAPFAAAAADCFLDALARMRTFAEQWRTEDPAQQAKIERLRADLTATRRQAAAALGARRPEAVWDGLYRWARAALSHEGRECLVGLLIEPHGAQVDDLCERMDIDEDRCFDLPAATVAGLRRALSRRCGWALRIDFSRPAARARFWHLSAEKLEPRLGERAAGFSEDWELPLAIARDIRALARDLDRAPAAEPLASFLLRHSRHRRAARRVAFAPIFPYGEIRGNLIDSATQPIDLLRCKLSFFGATQFDPRSDRWLRIAMYQNAPYPDEFARAPVDDWALPKAA